MLDITIQCKSTSHNSSRFLMCSMLESRMPQLVDVCDTRQLVGTAICTARLTHGKSNRLRPVTIYSQAQAESSL